jgi:hypothetical protein
MEPNLNKILEASNPASNLYYWALENGRLPEGYEKLFIEFFDTYFIYLYVVCVVEGRWKEIEEKLCQEGDAWALWKYATEILKRRWPEAEPILKESTYWGLYCKEFGVKDGIE